MNKISKPLFKGAATAIITPFNDGKIDFASFGKLIDIQIKSGISAIVVCGTTGEASTMSEKEHLLCIDFALQRANGKIPILAGTGSNSTEKSVKLSKKASKMGLDGILVITPYYNKTSDKGLITHFEKIAEASECPIILYNVPSRTGMTISLEVYKELSKHENIVAVKEASGNISSIASIASECKDDLYIYSGNDDQILPILSLGGMGVISVISNIVPKETQMLCSSFFEKDFGKAKDIQLKLLPLCRAMFCEVNPIPIKYAMSLMKLCTSEIRLPLCKPSSSSAKLIASTLKSFNLT